MSTRGVIAIPLDNGFTGRYVHWDGQPDTKINQLLSIVAEKGLEWTRKTIVEDHVSWSSITYPLIEDLPGVPHTDVEDNEGWQYTKDSFADGDTDIEWVYILNSHSLSVLQPDSTGLEHVGELTWGSEPTDEQIAALECGEMFERCKHMAWFHASSDEECDAMGEMNMDQWLGRQALGLRATKTIIDRYGRQFEITGSGSTGSARDPRDYFSSSSRYWWGMTKSGAPIRLARILKSGGYKLDVDLLMPATAVAGPHTVKRGSVINRY